MRCLSCNRRLTEFEATVKYASTGEFVDLCNRHRADLVDIVFIERADLSREEDFVDTSEDAEGAGDSGEWPED
jgi:hypothetical protein